MRDNLIKYGSWALMALLTIVCAFFIVHDAQWVIGDDAMILENIGMGKMFDLGYTIWPESGRFFPFAYQMYNVLPLVFDGYISAKVLYGFHAIHFVIGSILVMLLLLRVQEKEDGCWKYFIAVLGVLFLGARCFPGFMNCFSTTWHSYFTQSLLLLSFLLFYQRKSILWGLLSFGIVVWSTYCSEVSFVLPLTWGFCGLVLRWKTAEKQEKVFYWLLIVNAVVFLLVYYFGVRIHMVKSYDGAHGSGVTMMGNAINILYAQKFLWIAILLLCVRVWDVLVRKSEITIYDIFLLAAAGHCCGGFILKLNWVLYYNRAIYFALPAVVYYGNYYLKGKWTALIMFVFAVFYCAKIPQTTKAAVENRNNTIAFMNIVLPIADELVWYAPNVDNESENDMVARSWKKNALQVYLQYLKHDPTYTIRTLDTFDENESYYLTCPENEVLSVNGNRAIEQACCLVGRQDERDIKLYKVK